jgi:hypothetical protein
MIERESERKKGESKRVRERGIIGAAKREREKRERE